MKIRKTTSRHRDNDFEALNGGDSISRAPATCGLVTGSNTNRLSSNSGGYLSRSNSARASRSRANSASDSCSFSELNVHRGSFRDHRRRVNSGPNIDSLYLLPQASGIMVPRSRDLLPVRRTRSARESPRVRNSRRMNEELTRTGGGSLRSSRQPRRHHHHEVTVSFTRALSDAPPSYSDTCLANNDVDHLAVPSVLCRRSLSNDTTVTSRDPKLPSYNEVVTENYPLFHSLQDVSPLSHHCSSWAKILSQSNLDRMYHCSPM